MRKYYLMITGLFLAFQAYAVQHTITIVGTSYSPATINAAVGDTINFPASGSHPMVQVDQSTWNAGGTTQMPGGFGVQNMDFQYQILFASDIYFVCQFHASIGMKGRVLVTTSNVAEMIGQNNIKLLSNFIDFKELTVINSTDRAGELQVYDVSGKLLQVHNVTNESKQQVEVVLPKGIYIYRFKMEGMWSQAERLYIARDL